LLLGSSFIFLRPFEIHLGEPHWPAQEKTLNLTDACGTQKP
jgi:hypothetical protein